MRRSTDRTTTKPHQNPFQGVFSMTEKKYQVKLKIEIATPLHVNAENAQEAIDKAHELF